MNPPLILPMMMFGTFTVKESKKDKDGKPIKKNGKYVYVSAKKTYSEENGDLGLFPSVNHIYVNMAKGRKRLSAGAEKLKEKWTAYAQMWAKDNQWEITKAEKVIVEVTPYFPNDNIKRDASNAFKLLMDALEDVIYDNDFYGLPRVMDFQKVKDGESPYFEVNIYKKEDEINVLLERIRSAGLILPADG